MMKIFLLLSAMVAVALAKPTVAVVAPAPIVTATSSQYYHRINNGLAAYVAAPAYAPYVAAPYVAASAPYVAAPAPYVASPYVAAAAPIVV